MIFGSEEVSGKNAFQKLVNVTNLTDLCYRNIGCRCVGVKFVISMVSVGKTSHTAAVSKTDFTGVRLA